MPKSTTTIKPTHKSIQHYYEALQGFDHQHVKHESALRSAFQTMLAETAKTHGWFLVPELSTKAGGNRVVPDGTLRDPNNLPRGYWEAKDSDDDLDVEISKKIAKGYPLSNMIFEDTQRAVLFQDKREVLRVDMRQPRQLADLLNQFYAYTEPDIEKFEQAVEEFKQRVPDLAHGLADKIRTAHSDDKKFQDAFETFFTLCQTNLNPNISRDAVDEMLVQHLLTERLIRTIFDNPEFTKRNVIAVEVEKVIAALVSHSFSREEFLKSLDRFYRAIENAARTLEDFSEKQHFLNSIYERFFQGYSIKVADTHGIVYTPQAIVDFMCASVAQVLQTEFALTLGSPDVNILDPCTGTGNFIVNIMRRIPKKDIVRMYSQQLFANELMLLPYYIAALNIEHAFYELTGEYQSFEGLCFVDTLDLAQGAQKQLSFMTEANTARVERQKKTPITVVIGNPPYNMNQQNENDNNKNRKYPALDTRIRQTYGKDSRATLNNKLYDPYVRFFRWAIDRLGQQGVVCFVTNNSFIDKLAFDGMRKHLLQDFSRIFHINLQGDVKENPELSGTAYNVFGIQVGVGITIGVRARGANHALSYHALPTSWRRQEKLNWLRKSEVISKVEWQELIPDDEFTWIVPAYSDEFRNFLPMSTKEGKSLAKGQPETIFKIYSLGISSNRDEVVYDFDQAALARRVEAFCDDYNSEVDRFKRKGRGQKIDDFLDYSKVKWSSTLKMHLERGTAAQFLAEAIRTCLYRPFTRRFLYYDHVLCDRPGLFRGFFPLNEKESQNLVIGCTNHTQIPFVVQIANSLADAAIGGRGGQCFPFYVYHEDGTNRRENITDWALQQFREHYGDKKISKWDIFYYVYGMLHHPGYREKFADNLKRELPRIPFAPDFRAFATAGKELARLHVDYEKLEPYPLKWIETPGVPLSYHVEDKMRLNKDKTSLTVNPSLTLAGIPPETFHYRLGNRSALEWVIDQYQISEDKRSSIKSDPNRPDDPEYIVRLVGQVVRVSVDTVGIVSQLPTEYTSQKK